jgi:hypothetical protein
MQRRRAVLSLVVVALVAGGCGGGGGKDKAVGTTTTTVAPEPGTSILTTTTLGTDRVLAAKAVAANLQKADFPAGFEPQPDETGQGLGIDQVWLDVTRCLGVERTAAPAGTATSPTFKKGLATQGRSTVEYTTEPAASAVATALTGPKSVDCLTQAFAADVDRSKPEGAKPGPVKVATREVTVAGQRVLSWRINASVNLAELVVPLFQDFTVMFNKGTMIRLFFLNPGSEFPQDLEKTLVDAVVARA